MADDWINSLERAIEITESQLALADLVSAGGVRVDTEILRRLIQAAKTPASATGGVGWGGRMTERAYTVKEIDELRRAVKERYLWGSCAPSRDGRMSFPYKEEQMSVAVEEQVRTHMIAGHVAQDLINADTERTTTNQVG